jgi:hypothetical protein
MALNMQDARAVIYIDGGGRPQREEYMMIGDELWALLKACWDSDPTRRPSMAEMYQYLVSSHVSHPV